MSLAGLSISDELRSGRSTGRRRRTMMLARLPRPSIQPPQAHILTMAPMITPCDLLTAQPARVGFAVWDAI
jgi:hypothetical protein